MSFLTRQIPSLLIYRLFISFLAFFFLLFLTYFFLPSLPTSFPPYLFPLLPSSLPDSRLLLHFFSSFFGQFIPSLPTKLSFLFLLSFLPYLPAFFISNFFFMKNSFPLFIIYWLSSILIYLPALFPFLFPSLTAHFPPSLFSHLLYLCISWFSFFSSSASFLPSLATCFPSFFLLYLLTSFLPTCFLFFFLPSWQYTYLLNFLL